MVSSNDNEVSDDISMGSFVKFGSPSGNACVIQCGIHGVDLGELKGFPRIYSEAGVEHK